MLAEAPNNVAAMIALTHAVCEGVRAAGAGGVPAGHLYAMLMPSGCTLTQFEAAVRVAEGAKLIERAHHLLTWIGPVLPEKDPTG